MYFFTSDMIYAIRQQMVDFFHKYIFHKDAHIKGDECL